MDRGTLLATTAVIIAILGFGAIYSGISSLKTQLDEANSKINELQKEIQTLKETSQEYASSSQIANLQESIEMLARDIQDLRSKVGTAATQKDIEELAVQLASLQERLSSIEALAGDELKSRIEELSMQLADLQEEVKDLAERVKFPVTVTDATGEDVFIPAEPQRIVSLAPAATETLYFIGALDKLVGVDEYSNYPPEVIRLVEQGSLETIGGFWTPSIEKILALNPDLVIGVDAPPHRQVKEVLKDYGIPVIILPQASINDVKRSIVITGLATGNLDQAINVLTELNSVLASVKRLASQVEEPVKVALIVWINPIFVAGNDTFQNDIIEFAGGINAFGNLSGWPVISAEDLVNAKPDVIILSGINTTDFINTLVNQIGDAALSIPAIVEKRIYTITGDYSDMLSRPSPRIAQIIPLIQYILYPDMYNGSVPPNIISPDTMPEPPRPPQG